MVMATRKGVVNSAALRREALNSDYACSICVLLSVVCHASLTRWILLSLSTSCVSWHRSLNAIALLAVIVYHLASAC